MKVEDDVEDDPGHRTFACKRGLRSTDLQDCLLDVRAGLCGCYGLQPGMRLVEADGDHCTFLGMLEGSMWFRSDGDVGIGRFKAVTFPLRRRGGVPSGTLLLTLPDAPQR